MLPFGQQSFTRYMVVDYELVKIEQNVEKHIQWAFIPPHLVPEHEIFFFFAQLHVSSQKNVPDQNGFIVATAKRTIYRCH